MKYLVFWYLAIPVMLVAMMVDWNRGIKPVSSLAWAGVVLIAQVTGWIKEIQDNKSSQKANDAAVRCKHGIKTWHSCKGCAEEFAYFETCALCGMRWDNRIQKHDHKMIPDSSGRPEYFLNGQKLVMSSSYWSTGGYSGSYMSGMNSLAIDTRVVAPAAIIPAHPLNREMKLVQPTDEGQTHG
jgi:hypothetical protein